jgi:hypothetical protein
MEESLARDVARKLRGPTRPSIPDTAIGVLPPYHAGWAAALSGGGSSDSLIGGNGINSLDGGDGADTVRGCRHRHADGRERARPVRGLSERTQPARTVLKQI